jgi:CTP synthase (UTP-ammonia lyase)
MAKLALIGDYDPEKVAHRAIPVALRAAAAELGLPACWDWVETSVLSQAAEQLAAYDAIWCVPGSPWPNARR